MSVWIWPTHRDVNTNDFVELCMRNKTEQAITVFRSLSPGELGDLGAMEDALTFVFKNDNLELLRAYLVRNTVVHFEISAACRLRAVQCLRHLFSSSQFAFEQDRFLSPPLHELCRSTGSHSSFVECWKLVVDHRPEWMSLRNTAGDLPIHILAEYNPFLLSVVMRLPEQYRPTFDMLQQRNRGFLTPVDVIQWHSGKYKKDYALLWNDYRLYMQAKKYGIGAVESPAITIVLERATPSIQFWFLSQLVANGLVGRGKRAPDTEAADNVS